MTKETGMDYSDFQTALREGDVVRLGVALKEYPEWVNEQDSRGFTPLIMAAYYEHAPVVEFLLEFGANADATDASGNTALMGACFKGFDGMVELLVRKGADVNAQNLNGATPLIYACTFNRPNIAAFLLQKGADKSIRDISGLTAVDHAKNQGLQWAGNLMAA